MYKKILIVVLSLTLLALVAVGGTLSWLYANPVSIENVFTAGNITLDLKENTGTTYTMVPGVNIPKDPRVIVGANSEKCYVYVKIEKTAQFDTYMEYAMAEGWTALDGHPGIFFRTVDKKDTEQSFDVIKDNSITTKRDITKEQLNTLTGSNQPKLTVTAYAVQFEAIGTAVEAWNTTFGAQVPPETSTL